jgi:hypothetical protein
MAEWGIPFSVIEAEWTDRQFALMLARLADRKKSERKASKGDSGMIPYK